MPIYEYRCKNDHTFEVRQSFSDGPVTNCEECGASVERVYHPIAVHFKGSGFYNTDYGTSKRSRELKEGKEGKESKDGKEGSSSESASKSDSSSSSDTKSDSSGGDSKPAKSESSASGSSSDKAKK